MNRIAVWSGGFERSLTRNRAGEFDRRLVKEKSREGSLSRARRRKAGEAITVELECLACGKRESLNPTSENFRALSSKWKVARNCRACGRRTDWSFAQAGVKAEEEVDFWDWLATTGEYFEPPQFQVQDEQRREPRVELRVPLRITRAGGEEEEVASENISQSGFCFSSLKPYAIGETLQVTLQPPGATVLQVKTATIVRSSPAREGATLYGARLTH